MGKLNEEDHILIASAPLEETDNGDNANRVEKTIVTFVPGFEMDFAVKHFEISKFFRF